MKAGDFMIKSTDRSSLVKRMLNRILYLTLILSMLFTLSFASQEENIQPELLGDEAKFEESQISDAIGELNYGDGVYATLREIMSILAWAGFAIAVFKVLQIGMMFMLGAGKAKSDAKSALVPWLVGAAVCVLFGTVGPAIINLIMGGSSGGSIFDI